MRRASKAMGHGCVASRLVRRPANRSALQARPSTIPMTRPHVYERPRTPALAVDVIVELADRPERPIVLVERRNQPRGWALPGGFVDIGESVERAAAREALEEISLSVHLLTLLGVYSDPGRDPRGHTVSVVFVAAGRGDPVAADDARRVALCSLEHLPSPLAFDHELILHDYRKFRTSGETTPIRSRVLS